MWGNRKVKKKKKVPMLPHVIFAVGVRAGRMFARMFAIDCEDGLLEFLSLCLSLSLSISISISLFFNIYIIYRYI